MITTDQVKQLRDETSVSVMQCKKALEEANGDMEAARTILKAKSAGMAEKKAGRTLGSGRVATAHEDNKAVLVSVLCETDFVAKNDDFIALADTLAQGTLAGSDVDQGAIEQAIQKIGENIQFGESQEISGETLGVYIHGGRLGVVVTLSGGNEDLAKDIAMHIAAMKPEFVSLDQVTDAEKASMTEVFQKDVDELDKSDDIKAKVLAGKVDTYFKERILTEQSFVKDPSTTVGTLLEEAGATVEKFILLEV